jgi:hypothetical protein
LSAVEAFKAITRHTRDEHAGDTNWLKHGTVAMGAANGFACGREQVAGGAWDGVNSGFDAPTNGFDGDAHAGA